MIFGSARSDENYRASGGKAGDQRQTSTSKDTKGEVSMQSDYDHSKGWYLYRPKDGAKANRMASEMVYACNNPHIGYDQGQRTTLMSQIKNNKLTSIKDVTVDCETDCAQLIRAVVYVVYGVDLNEYAGGGNFYTGNAGEAVLKTGLFKKVDYVSCKKTTQYNGDIKCTKTKGHIGMLVQGNPRTDVQGASTVTATSSAGTVSVKLPVLSKGMICPEVGTWQKLLTASGFICVIDNDFGSKTEEQTIAWQKTQSGFSGTGTVAEKTWNRMLLGI